MDKLRQRVSNAEEQLKGVRAENTRLRQDKLDAGCAPEDAHEQAMAAAAAARREPPGRRGHNPEEVETLHRELREAQVEKTKKNATDERQTNSIKGKNMYHRFGLKPVINTARSLAALTQTGSDQFRD